MRRSVPIAFLGALVIAPLAHAATATWTAGNGSWNVATNWSTGAVPTAADDVVVNTAVTISINAMGTGANGVASSVSITAGATITRAGARTLTVGNGISVNSSGNASITVPFTAASMTKSGSGPLTLNGVALSGGGTEVSGNVDVTGGTLQLNGANTFTIGGVVTVGAGATLARAGGGALAPTGGLTVNGGSVTFAAGGGLTSGGPVNVTAGSISFAGAGGLSATDVTLSGGSITLGAGGDLTASGVLTVGAGANVSTSAGANITAGTVTINGGSIAFGGNGSLTASVGAVSVTSAGSLSFAGSGDVFAQSFSLASGSSFTINFATGGNPTNVNLTGGSGALNGTVNITGTPNSNTSFNIVTGAGSVDITGVTLGAVPGGQAFGFHLTGTTTIVLDVTVNPIAPDGTGSATGACGSPLTWQHTIGATANDRYLLVGVSTGASAVTPASVSFGGQGMTLLTSQVTGTSGAFLYGLAAPARGTGTITVTLPAGPCSAVGGSISYTGVDQTTSTGTAATAGGTGTTASVSPSTIQGDKVISVLGSNGATSATPQAGATVRWSSTSGTVLGAGDTASRTGAGTFNVTMSWTLAPSSEFALVAIPIRASAPTRASDFAATVRASPRGAVVSVRSGSGSDLIGFRVWREVSGRRELLTPGLVAGPLLSRRASLLAGNDAGWEDLHAIRGAAYLVESLHRDGRTRWTRATPSAGPAPAFSSDLVADSAPVLLASPAPRSVAAVSAPQPTALNQSVQWQLASNDAVKLVVSHAGVVRVPAESLFAVGISVGAPAASLQLFRNGQAIPRTVLAADGATLRAGDSVEFYGYGMDNRYSGSAVYWLVSGPATGMELASVSSTAQPTSPATYAAAVEVRERLGWFGSAQNGDAQKFFGPAVFGATHQRTLPVDALDASAPGARLEVALQGTTDVSHSIALSVNGLTVGTVAFDGVVPGAASIPLPPGVLVPGDNVVAMVASGGEDVSLEQYVRLVYPRLTTRGTGALDFTLASGSAARLDGFDASRTQVLDITNPDAPFRVAVQDSSGAPAVLATGSGTRHLFAYQPEDASAPASIGRNNPSSLHNAAGADLVVVGPPALFDAIRPLVERRQSEGLTVAIVDVEDVQDEFAGGEKSVDALRSFLARALTAWQRPPRYVLLLGKATFDPRDYLGLGGDLVPSAAVQTVETEAVSDSWFLGTAATGSISIGRLPVQTAAETQAVVAKILGRRAATSRSQWVLASDDSSTSDFPEMTADMRAAFPLTPATVLVRGTDTDDVVHQRFLDAARAGPGLVTFVGHAAELFWTGANPPIYAAEDVAALAGSDTSLWMELTCWTGFFQDPRRQSLAVATLLAPSGGSWSAWAGTGGTAPTDHPALAQALVNALLVDGKTLGEATRTALTQTSDPEVQSTFVLLGDPSARAVATQALETAPKPAIASGCTSADSGPVLALLLALAAWLAAIPRRRVRRSDR